MSAAATRNRRRGAVNRNRRHARRTPAWGLVLAGLLIGSALAAGGFWLRSRLTTPPAPPTAAAAEKPTPRPRPKPSAAPPEKRFEFYEMLPNFEVVVPEEDGSARPDATPAPVAAPGVYVLQAGSYASFAEADRVKARIALLGIASQIQRITVDEREYHRVRIGPIENLDELNRARRRLREAKIDVLVIRVGE